MRPAVCVFERGLELIPNMVQRAGASKLQVSPLRQTIRPLGFGRDDKSLLYACGEYRLALEDLLGDGG